VIQYVRQSAALAETPTRAPLDQNIRRLAFFGQLREGKGIRIFVDALEAVADALRGIELVFLGASSARWSPERIEAALSPAVRELVGGIRFETQLDRESALEELCRPGTLAVMPSLLDNAPNTVSECIEHGIPFVATSVGGIPELVAEADHARVLCGPTTDALAAALLGALKTDGGFPPAQPARDPAESLAAWLELLASVVPASRPPPRAATHVSIVAGGEKSARRAEELAARTGSVEVEVVAARSRSDGLARTASDWVVFLDDDDEPDDELVDTLVSAQAASKADVVTTAVRPDDDPAGIQLFLGDPGALGLVENHYGVLGLVRSDLVAGQPLADDGIDPDWPLFARIALAGGRIVSIPEPLATNRGRPGRINDVPGDGLAVLEAFEERRDAAPADLPQLAATLAASADEPPSIANAAGPRPPLRSRVLRVLQNEGVGGIVRRVRARFD
jgi:hypothetical protein